MGLNSKFYRGRLKRHGDDQLQITLATADVLFNLRYRYGISSVERHKAAIMRALDAITTELRGTRRATR